MTPDIIPLPPVEEHRGYPVPIASLFLGCSPPTTYQAIKDGRLASVTLGKRRIINGSEIIRFLSGAPKPQVIGDPISPQMSARGRTGGKAGGLAKARKAMPAKVA